MKYSGELREIVNYRTLRCLDSDEIKNFDTLGFLSTVDRNEFNEKDEPELWDLCANQTMNTLADATEEPEDDGSRDWWDKI